MPTRKKGGKKAVKDFASLTVKDVMEKRVQCARLTTKGDVIASLMIEGFGAVPVVDSGRRLVGIVSEHDLLAAIDDGHQLGRITAGDIMTVITSYSIHYTKLYDTGVRRSRRQSRE